MLSNQDIRLLAKGTGVPLWKISEALKISEPTLTRKLRKELPEIEKEKIQAIIAELKEKNQ